MVEFHRLTLAKTIFDGTKGSAARPGAQAARDVTSLAGWDIKFRDSPARIREDYSPMPSELLRGFRLLDLTDEKGALCGKMFADLGAEVIKVEPIGGCSTQ